MTSSYYHRRVDQTAAAQKLADKHFGRPVRLLKTSICDTDSKRTVIGRVSWDSDNGMCLYGVDGKMFAYVSLPAE